MKNIKKLSNYSIAGLLAVGVILLSFFAYKQKIQADTIVPGFATAHVNIHVTVPTIEAVKFKVTFLPQSPSSKRYYFKEREFDLSAAGLNTIEWYVRKIPSGSYKMILQSNSQELTNSPKIIGLTNDKVNDTGSFDLYIGEPVPSPQPTEYETSIPIEDENLDFNLPSTDYNYETPIPAENYAADPSPAASTSTYEDTPPVPEINLN